MTRSCDSMGRICAAAEKCMFQLKPGKKQTKTFVRNYVLSWQKPYIKKLFNIDISEGEWCATCYSRIQRERKIDEKTGLAHSNHYSHGNFKQQAADKRVVRKRKNLNTKSFNFTMTDQLSMDSEHTVTLESNDVSSYETPTLSPVDEPENRNLNGSLVNANHNWSVQSPVNCMDNILTPIYNADKGNVEVSYPDYDITLLALPPAYVTIETIRQYFKIACSDKIILRKLEDKEIIKLTTEQTLKPGNYEINVIERSKAQAIKQCINPKMMYAMFLCNELVNNLQANA